jgi:hypothetical protein
MTGKFLFTLVGILIAFFAICNLDFSQPIIEGWAGMDGMRSVTVRKVIQDPRTGQIISMGHDTTIDPVACGGPVGGGTDRASVRPSTERYRRGGQYKENYGGDQYPSGPSPYENPNGGPMRMAPASGSMMPQQVPSNGKVEKALLLFKKITRLLKLVKITEQMDHKPRARLLAEKEVTALPTI